MTLLAISARRRGRVEARVDEVDGRPLAYFRIDAGMDELGAATAAKAVARAAADGYPVIGVLAGVAPDPATGVAGIAGWGRLASALSAASGVVPTGLVVAGPVTGGPALLLGLVDLVAVTDDAVAYLTGPRPVHAVTGVTVSSEALGGAGPLAAAAVAALRGETESDALDLLVAALGYLPPNNGAAPPRVPHADPIDRRADRAAAAVPVEPARAYEMRTVISDVCDAGSFLELWSACGQSMVVGLATIDGNPVGVVANQPAVLAGTINIDAAVKAARFVQLCDAFNVPLVTFVDTPGFQPGRDLETRGMIRYGAQLVHAYAKATVPRVCVVVRKAYGGAYIVMDSAGLGSDHVIAWPGAEIAVMGAAGAVQVLHGRRGFGAGETAALVAEYEATYCTPAIAAERGFVDDIIDPAGTRRIVALALRALRNKRDVHPVRRHANGPL